MDMINKSLKLRSRDYKEVNERLIFYLSNKVGNRDTFDIIQSELKDKKNLLITSTYRKNKNADRRFSLYAGKIVINFTESDKFNFACTKILIGERAIEKKRNLYKNKVFKIIPTGGIYFVYNGQLYPECENTSWSMDTDVYQDILDSMTDYFETEESEDSEEIENKKKKERIPERFVRNILKPFRSYTEKEDWVERSKQAKIQFYKAEYVNTDKKGPIYNFYYRNENPIIDEDEDEQVYPFNVGERISIEDENEDEKCHGELLNIDDESDDAVIFTISFSRQIDDKSIPRVGNLVLSTNDIQKKVRERVCRAMGSGKVPSSYMYKTFTDYSVAGYEQPQEDLTEYLMEELAGEFPPNQMQMEAIIKGVLTDDLLLVLGPPGTGKTTVISFWVKYFIKQNKRVLISSQNNAAVDNVLARFGEVAETVRLGNENKVQENCKPYLPQYKISSMQDYYNENYDRVMKTIAYDEQELEEYNKKLFVYKDLDIDVYSKYHSYKPFKEYVVAGIKKIISMKREIDLAEYSMDDIRRVLAYNENFLKVYEQKNVLIRFIRRRAAKRARVEIEENIKVIKGLRQKYVEYVSQYNGFVKEFEREILKYREAKVLESFKESRDIVYAYIQEMHDDNFFPHFKGPVSNLFGVYPIFPDLIKNVRLVVRSEMDRVMQIKESIENIKKALIDWNEVVNNERNDIMQNALLETCQIVGATCIGINSNRAFSDVKFDVAIIDESGQIQIHNALVPMSRAPKNLLLGDYKQIPPCANEEVIKACEQDDIDTNLLNMSFFEYIFESMRNKVIAKLNEQGLDRKEFLKPVLENYEPKRARYYTRNQVSDMVDRVINDPKKLVNLNSQFRMPGHISDIISEWFYEGNYYSSYNMDKFMPMVPNTERPLVVIRTSDSRERCESQPESKMGYQNEYEAKIIVKIIQSVIAAQSEEQRIDFIEHIEDKIGIISAYGAQVRLIRQYLNKAKTGATETQVRSMVASLDSFQGQERPLILYSLTRSTTYKKPESGRVGFMKELRRLNVAFTRCQKQLVIIGDIDYLSECMNIGKNEDVDAWPCEGMTESNAITPDVILQCSECSATCERKFARFIRLLMQHVNDEAGDLLQSDNYLQVN